MIYSNEIFAVNQAYLYIWLSSFDYRQRKYLASLIYYYTEEISKNIVLKIDKPP